MIGLTKGGELVNGSREISPFPEKKKGFRVVIITATAFGSASVVSVSSKRDRYFF